MFRWSTWVIIWQIIYNRHGITSDSLCSLTLETQKMLIQDAITDLNRGHQKRLQAQFNGSVIDYHNHLARQNGYKNKYEQDKAIMEKNGFVRPQDYYNHWAQERGFADFNAYKQFRKREKLEELVREVQTIWSGIDGQSLEGGR